LIRNTDAGFTAQELVGEYSQAC